MNPLSQFNFNWIRLAVAGCLLIVVSGFTIPFVEQQRSKEPGDWSVFLPEGEGKAEVALSCSSCHDLRQTIIQKKTNANWNRTVRKMISTYHAPVDPTDIPVIVDYLSKHFGESNPIEQLPMNINTASHEALARLPGVSAEMANAIIECRLTQGLFASIEDLTRVKGLAGVTLEKIKPYIKVKE